VGLALAMVERLALGTAPCQAADCHRERYGAAQQTSRKQAMKAIVGMWRDREDLSDAGAYVRQLRKGKRLKRLVS
jgi:hypothetical protein